MIGLKQNFYGIILRIEMQYKIAFRCDASPSVGVGHLVRCIALATYLKKADDIFSMMLIAPVADYTHYIPSGIFDEIEEVEFKGSLVDAERLVEINRLHKKILFVLDDYRIDDLYQIKLNEEGVKWLQFDNSQLKNLWADIVLNASLSCNEKDYTNLIKNSSSQLVLGSEYLILKNDVYQAKIKYTKNENKYLSVFMGGGDDRGSLVIIMSFLMELKISTPIIVISDKNNPRNESNRSWINSKPGSNIEYVENPDNLFEILCNSKICICSGGNLAYELSYLEIPMMIISLANNQESQARYWHKLQAAIYLGKIEDVQIDQIEKGLLKSFYFRPNHANVSSRAADLVGIILNFCRSM